MASQSDVTNAVNVALSSRPVTVAALLLAIGSVVSAVFQPLSGDLSGVLPNPQVVSAAHLPAGSITGAQLQSGAAAANMGAASGDVSGSYPGPLKVVQVNGAAFPASGLIKSNAGAPAAAVAGTDYLAPTGSGAALTGITASQVGGLAPSATTDTTNASNIKTGTLSTAQISSYFPGLTTSSVATSGPGMNVPCTGALDCGFALFSTPPSYSSGAGNAILFRLDRSAPASGGVATNTYLTFNTNTTTGLNDPGSQWGVSSIMHVRTLGTSANANTGEIAGAFSTFKELNGQPAGSEMAQAYGIYAECSDLTGVTMPKDFCAAAELDNYAEAGSGPDPNRARIGIAVNGGSYSGNDANVHINTLVALGSNNSATIDNAIRLGAYSSGAAGAFLNGFNTAEVSILNAALYMSAGQSIAFDGTGSGKGGTNNTAGTFGRSLSYSASQAKLAYTNPNGTFGLYDSGTLEAPGSLTGHNHLYGQGAPPSVAVGSGAVGLSTGANDMHGTISLSAATTVTMTFAAAYTNAPDCTLTTWFGAAATINSVSNTALKFTASAASQTFTYHCMGK